MQHNLRYYPVVQQIRRMIEAGDLGEILIVQGTYSQDWLLYDTDWNWRMDAKDNGALRAMGDIGSHWMDMIQHLTGPADHRPVRRSGHVPQATRKQAERLRGDVRRQNSAARRLRGRPDSTPKTSAPCCCTWAIERAARSLSARCRPAARTSSPSRSTAPKPASAWNQERPDELWIGHRNAPNQIIVKDPSLLYPAGRRITPTCRAATAKATTTPTSRCSSVSTPASPTRPRRWITRRSRTARGACSFWRRSAKARKSEPG